MVRAVFLHLVPVQHDLQLVLACAYPNCEVSPLSTAATPAQDSAPKRSTRFNYNHVSVQN